MMSSIVQEMIEKKLRAAFLPNALEVINESHLHAGHHHHDHTFERNGETHFRVKIVSKKFDGIKRVDRHRAINHVLKQELNHNVHALAIEAKAPGES